MEAQLLMVNDIQRFDQVNQVRQFINETLCDRDQLLLGCFPISERLLLRSGEPWGVLYCLHGPRSVQLTAVWDASTQYVVFYGSRGERFRKTRIHGAAAI